MVQSNRVEPTVETIKEILEDLAKDTVKDMYKEGWELSSVVKTDCDELSDTYTFTKKDSFPLHLSVKK